MGGGALKFFWPDEAGLREKTFCLRGAGCSYEN